MKFTKMQGCGNDYVLIYGEYEEKKINEKKQFVKEICDRHYGIGADGVLFVSEKRDDTDSINKAFCMEIYNEDGSRAQMCGNGIRCVAKYLFEKGYTLKKEFDIYCSGVKKTAQILFEQDTTYVKIDMGKPDFQAKKVPVLIEKEFAINEPFLEDMKELRVTCVSMGNPHAVMIVDSLQNYDIEEIGKRMAYLPRFPEHTNVEIVEIEDKNSIKMHVWERGVGQTLACGTGACAAAVVSCINGLTAREVTVKLLGGKLFCEWDRENQHVYMTGPAELVYEGDMNIY